MKKRYVISGYTAELKGKEFYTLTLTANNTFEALNDIENFLKKPFYIENIYSEKI